MSIPIRPAVIWSACLLACAACASPGSASIQAGMSQKTVLWMLGQPDRKALLAGKELRDLDSVPEKDISRFRQVYVYESTGLQVWFDRGRVTGITRHGVSIQ